MYFVKKINVFLRKIVEGVLCVMFWVLLHGWYWIEVGFVSAWEDIDDICCVWLSVRMVEMQGLLVGVCCYKFGVDDGILVYMLS